MSLSSRWLFYDLLVGHFLMLGYMNIRVDLAPTLQHRYLHPFRSTIPHMRSNQTHEHAKILRCKNLYSLLKITSVWKQSFLICSCFTERVWCDVWQRNFLYEIVARMQYFFNFKRKAHFLTPVVFFSYKRKAHFFTTVYFSGDCCKVCLQMQTIQFSKVLRKGNCSQCKLAFSMRVRFRL